MYCFRSKLRKGTKISLSFAFRTVLPLLRFSGIEIPFIQVSLVMFISVYVFQDNLAITLTDRENIPKYSVTVL